MTFSDLLLMHQELLLTLLALIILFMEIGLQDKGRDTIIRFSLILFGAITLIGFLPFASGELFGGMFRTNPLLAIHEKYPECCPVYYPASISPLVTHGNQPGKNNRIHGPAYQYTDWYGFHDFVR